ncbi:jg26137 [Pararge aegeria aegeria]|uniref:Jg26137 protein n=1 Tax=Pararge aegeria aegeria TaxID=348720 RepID=A0A8S4S038_9NEOP|nr:jg26137 [Pararge aegeria aegeria]
MYLGSPCEFTCNPSLLHVYCEPRTGSCQCDPKHPVSLGVTTGCAKPKKLGEQCFYEETCNAFDPHASCVQVNHNAYCQCNSGYHTTSHSRPTQRIFCTEDLVLLTADMPTLLGVASGIFVLAGLLCMVLHLYTKARYHPAHLADARLTPPCLYSLNDTELISGVQVARRNTLFVWREQDGRSFVSLFYVSISFCIVEKLKVAYAFMMCRQQSNKHQRSSMLDMSGLGQPSMVASKLAYLMNKIVICSSHDLNLHVRENAGSRRPSLSSVQSSSSSIRSYSAKKWEREREQKERRQMSMRLAQLHDKMAAGREIPKHAPTPSPRSPNNSTDGLLPSVCEIREIGYPCYLAAIGPGLLDLRANPPLLQTVPHSYEFALLKCSEQTVTFSYVNSKGKTLVKRVGINEICTQPYIVNGEMDNSYVEE